MITGAAACHCLGITYCITLIALYIVGSSILAIGFCSFHIRCLIGKAMQAKTVVAPYVSTGSRNRNIFTLSNHACIVSKFTIQSDTGQCQFAFLLNQDTLDSGIIFLCYCKVDGTGALVYNGIICLCCGYNGRNAFNCCSAIVEQSNRILSAQAGVSNDNIGNNQRAVVLDHGAKGITRGHTKVTTIDFQSTTCINDNCCSRSFRRFDVKHIAVQVNLRILRNRNSIIINPFQQLNFYAVCVINCRSQRPILPTISKNSNIISAYILGITLGAPTVFIFVLATSLLIATFGTLAIHNGMCFNLIAPHTLMTLC